MGFRDRQPLSCLLHIRPELTDCYLLLDYEDVSIGKKTTILCILHTVSWNIFGEIRIFRDIDLTGFIWTKNVLDGVKLCDSSALSRAWARTGFCHVWLSRIFPLFVFLNVVWISVAGSVNGKCAYDSISLLRSREGPSGRVCGEKNGYATLYKIKGGEEVHSLLHF